MVLAYGRVEIGVAVEDFRDAQVMEVLIVFGERRRGHVRACLRREWDEEAADAAGGADHEHGLALGGREGVEGGECADSRQGRGRGVRMVEVRWFGCDEVVFRNGDQLGPAAVVNGWVGVEEEAVDL